jgi:hypothetical protein
LTMIEQLLLRFLQIVMMQNPLQINLKLRGLKNLLAIESNQICFVS